MVARPRRNGSRRRRGLGRLRSNRRTAVGANDAVRSFDLTNRGTQRVRRGIIGQ